MKTCPLGHLLPIIPILESLEDLEELKQRSRGTRCFSGPGRRGTNPADIWGEIQVYKHQTVVPSELPQDC